MLYSTTANLICTNFCVYFPKTAQFTAEDTVQCAVQCCHSVVTEKY